MKRLGSLLPATYAVGEPDSGPETCLCPVCGKRQGDYNGMCPNCADTERATLYLGIPSYPAWIEEI